MSSQAVAQVKQVEEMPTRFIEVFRQGDLPALIALFAPDASYIPTVGKSPFDGIEGIRGYYGNVFKNSKSRNITFTNERWQKYGDIVVRSADIVIHQDLLDGQSRDTPSRVSFVCQKGADGWRIAHHHGSMLSTPLTTSTVSTQSTR
jgi:uncharacterized protein (TIGR02246 family)